MKPQVARVKHPAALRLDQEGHGVVNRVIDRIGRHLKWPDSYGLTGHQDPSTGLRHAGLTGKKTPGQDHLARALAHPHRHLGPARRDESVVVGMGMAKEQAIHRRALPIEQPGNGRWRIPAPGIGIKRQTGIKHDAGGTRCYFDAGSANLV